MEGKQDDHLCEKTEQESDDGGTIAQKDSNPGQRHICMRFLKRVKARLLFSGDGINPPNWPVIGLMFLSLFASAFTLTFLFPFLPEMIVGFGYTEEEKGYYAGLVTSSVFAGRATGSYFWGWLSDRKGRKLVLILTLGGSGVFSLFFGFTQNLGMAIAARFFTGLFSGILGTAKTVLYEVSDDTNQAVGMSMISLAWGGGIILGPATGGYLASPGSKYPNAFSAGFFRQFPYILPAVVTFIVNVVALLVIAFKLPETLRKTSFTITVPSEKEKLTPRDADEECHCEGYCSRSRSYGDLNLNAQFKTKLQYNNLSKQETFATECETQQLMKADSCRLQFGDCENSKMTNSVEGKETKMAVANGMRNISAKNYKNMNRIMCYSVPDLRFSDLKPNQHTLCSCRHRSNQECSKKSCEDIQLYEKTPSTPKIDLANSDTSLKKGGLWNALLSSSLFTYMKQSDVRQSVTLFTVFSFAIIGFDDVFTVWASTDSRLDGLGFSTDMIGTVLSIVGIPLLLLLLFIFSTLVNHFGIKKTYMICAFILTVAVTICPTLHMLTDRSHVLLPVLLLVLIPVRLCASCCFSATALFINNSVTPEHAGAVNGIGMTFTAIARTLAPAIGGSVFAWTVTHGGDIGAPFDVSLIFFMFGFVFWTTVVMCVFIPNRLNRQRKS